MPLVNCLINGKTEVDINIEDRALHYGDGLFETMLFNCGLIELWSQHYDRLRSGCEVLGLNLVDEVTLLNDLNSLTKGLKGECYIVKLIISRGAAGRGLTIDKSTEASSIFLAYDYDISQRGDDSTNRLKVCKTQLLMNKTLGGIKHLNRLLYVLAADELDDNYSEGIMLNDKDEMIECITHNLFFVKNDVLYTAPINDCGVAGIKRQQVLNIASQLDITVKIEAILFNDVKQMDECFITNAVVGLQSVKSINQFTFSLNTMTQQLKNSLKSI